MGAAAILVAIILPAEYGVDPTGIGAALGLTALNAPARTVQITEVVGGDETVPGCRDSRLWRAGALAESRGGPAEGSATEVRNANHHA